MNENLYASPAELPEEAGEEGKFKMKWKYGFFLSVIICLIGYGMMIPHTRIVLTSIEQGTHVPAPGEMAAGFAQAMTLMVIGNLLVTVGIPAGIVTLIMWILGIRKISREKKSAKES